MENISSLVIELARYMRAHGVPIGISEIIDSITIIENYLLLHGNNINESDLKEIIRSIFVKRESFNEVFEDAWRKILAIRNISKNINELRKQLEYSLNYLGLKYNQKIRSLETSASNMRGRKRYHVRELVASLSQLGFIKRYKKGYKVVNRLEADNIIREIAREGYNNLRDAYIDLTLRKLTRTTRNDIRKNPMKYIYADIDEKKLEKIETSKLLELGVQAYRNHQYKFARKIADILLNRNDLPQKIDRQGFAFIKEVSSSTNNSTLYQLISSNPRLVEVMIRENKHSKETVRKLISYIKKQDPSKLGEILSRIIKLKGYELKNELIEIIREIPLQHLSLIPKSFIKKLDKELRNELEYTIYLGEAYRALMEFLSTGSEAHLEYAESILAKADNIKKTHKFTTREYLLKQEKELYNLLETAKELAENPDSVENIEKFLSRIRFETAWQILSNLYTRSINPEVKRKIFNIALRLWYKETRFTKTRIVKGKEKIKNTHGEMNVRLTLGNIIRFQNNPIVCNRPRNIKSTQLIVDISGSMRKYSLWVLLTASAFSRYIYRMILFSDKSYVIEEKGLHRLIDILLNSEFRGLTNITQALREASMNNKVKRIILLSDLKQTINDEDPLEHILSLYRKGWRIAIIMPPDHNSKAYMRLRENGIPAYIVSEPEKASRVFYQAWRSLR